MEESAVTGSRRVGGNAGPSRTGPSWRERGSASDQLWRRKRSTEPVSPIRAVSEWLVQAFLWSPRAAARELSGRLPDWYLNRPRDVRPLPARLYRPCRSPQSLHCML